MIRRVMIDGEKFAAVRSGWYLTQEEFAQRLTMSVANVRRLEQSKEGGMQARNFRRLAELLQVTPDALHARIGVRSAAVAEVRLPQPAAVRAETIQRVVEVERFHGVSAARLEDRTGVDRGSSPVPAGSDKRFSVTVDGDCMEPRYSHGDVVIFSVEAVDREGIVEGRNYFVQLEGGENTFKRVFSDPTNPQCLILRCWNSAYADRSVDRRGVKLLARAIYRLLPDEEGA